MGRGESQNRPEGCRRRSHQPGTCLKPADAPQYRGGDRRKCRANAYARADTVAGRPLQMDAQVHAQGRSMAVRRGTEADPQTHLQGLYRKLAGRAARTGTRLRPDQHRRVQRPAAHHHGLAGRQAQRRRFDTPCIVGTVPQARGGILAPPRRRRHLDGRYLYPPRAAGTRRTRSLRNFGQRGRTRRRRAAEHRRPANWASETTTPRSRRSSPARRRANPNRVRCSTSRVPSAAPRHAPPSARSA